MKKGVLLGSCFGAALCFSAALEASDTETSLVQMTSFTKVVGTAFSNSSWDLNKPEDRRELAAQAIAFAAELQKLGVNKNLSKRLAAMVVLSGCKSLGQYLELLNKGVNDSKKAESLNSVPLFLAAGVPPVIKDGLLLLHRLMSGNYTDLQVFVKNNIEPLRDTFGQTFPLALLYGTRKVDLDLGNFENRGDVRSFIVNPTSYFDSDSPFPPLYQLVDEEHKDMALGVIAFLHCVAAYGEDDELALRAGLNLLASVGDDFRALGKFLQLCVTGQGEYNSFFMQTNLKNGIAALRQQLEQDDEEQLSPTVVAKDLLDFYDVTSSELQTKKDVLAKYKATFENLDGEQDVPHAPGVEKGSDEYTYEIAKFGAEWVEFVLGELGLKLEYLNYNQLDLLKAILFDQSPFAALGLLSKTKEPGNRSRILLANLSMAYNDLFEPKNFDKYFFGVTGQGASKQQIFEVVLFWLKSLSFGFRGFGCLEQQNGEEKYIPLTKYLQDDAAIWIALVGASSRQVITPLDMTSQEKYLTSMIDLFGAQQALFSAFVANTEAASIPENLQKDLLLLSLYCAGVGADAMLNDETGAMDWLLPFVKFWLNVPCYAAAHGLFGDQQTKLQAENNTFPTPPAAENTPQEQAETANSSAILLQSKNSKQQKPTQLEDQDNNSIQATEEEEKEDFEEKKSDREEDLNGGNELDVLVVKKQNYLNTEHDFEEEEEELEVDQQKNTNEDQNMTNDSNL